MVRASVNNVLNTVIIISSEYLRHGSCQSKKNQNLFTIYSKKDDKIFRVIFKLRQFIYRKLWMLPATLNIKQSGDGIIIINKRCYRSCCQQ